MKKLLTAGLASALVLGALAGGAQADTLGLTAPSQGSDSNSCPPDSVIAQATSDPLTPYFVPGPGTITQWQTITPDDASGQDVSLLVLKPVGDAFSVVAVDSRTIADPAPTLSSYTLSTPIPVSGGETFGLHAGGPDVVCDFSGGETPSADTLAGIDAAELPAPGQTIFRGHDDSPPGFALNVAVTFQPSPTAPPTTPPTGKHRKKCKKKKHRRSAESAKKKGCKKKKRK
jgi:hypothetical protein